MTEPIWYEFRNAVWESDYALAQDLLEKHPQLVSMCNDIGETVLHYLAVEDVVAGVEWLYANGFSLDTKNNFGTPMLFEVAMFASQDLFLWLVRHGANTNVRDKDGNDIFAHLIDNEKPEIAEFVKTLLARHNSETSLSS